MTPNRLSLVLSCVAMLAAWPVAAHAQAAGAAKPAVAASAPAPSGFTTRSASLPAKGLFQNDQLSAAARRQLDEMIVDAIGLQIEVALVVPVGPWNVEGQGGDERDLTPARLAAIKRYLADRGVDSRKVYVESRIDHKLKEPRLDVQVGGRPATD